MSHKPSDVVGANIFTVKENKLFCIVNYCSKFPVIKKMDGLSADSLIKAVMIVFADFGLPNNIVLDADTNFI